ncbi:MAG: ThuA domain-containing protein [Lentisphaerae bacterium]|nr:ThuA domain-containing protein [Lentisphaerota bacterium]
MARKIRVTVWNEFRHEKRADKQAVLKHYPQGIHHAIAAPLAEQRDMKVCTATLDEPEHGLTQAVLDRTDVLLWWGHCAHGDVTDEIAKRVQTRVLEGMGFIAIHSAHFSKPFKLLMGTNCSLTWRDIGERERLWNIAPSHPITQGIGDCFELPESEMYGERFDIPEPDQLIFLSWFQGGEVFRSGCCFNRGHGRVFYFSPGHETYPTFKDVNVQTVLRNAVRWAAATVQLSDSCDYAEPRESVVKPVKATRRKR